MPSELPRLLLARHGDTAWTDSRQRTGRTDIPLNAVGEGRARQSAERLRRAGQPRLEARNVTKLRGIAGFEMCDRWCGRTGAARLPPSQLRAGTLV
jgi:hypothetical protein